MNDPDAVAVTVPMDYVGGLFDLSGKVTLITGGASGLGEAIAVGFADCGAEVTFLDVDVARAERLVAAAGAQGRALRFIEADVTSRDAMESAVGEVLAAHGHIDVLVNCAGTAARHPAEDFPDEVWERVVRLNLWGTFLSCQIVGRTMIQRGSGRHREHGLHRRQPRLPGDHRLPAIQGRRHPDDPQPGAGVDRARCAGQCPRPVHLRDAAGAGLGPQAQLHQRVHRRPPLRSIAGGCHGRSWGRPSSWRRMPHPW